MRTEKIRVVRVKREGNHELEVPEHATGGAAGIDLMASERHVLAAGGRTLIKTGFSFEIPPGFVGVIRDRSGMAYKRGITTRAGVIDSDYRGEVGVVVVNESEDWQQINAGDRIAQMMVVPHEVVACIEVSELRDTERGSGGFGSTGA